MTENLEERIKQITQEPIEIVLYNPQWPHDFTKEKEHLLSILPHELIYRIEHFGSTAIPGLSAKPIIDILVEVRSLSDTKKHIVPKLTKQGYEYLWRPIIGESPPYYAWFIKRNKKNKRTHHIHMVEADSELWDRLYFRDYLREFPSIAKQYDSLKKTLAAKYPKDRVRYTKEKSAFIKKITTTSKHYYTTKHKT